MTSSVKGTKREKKERKKHFSGYFQGGKGKFQTEGIYGVMSGVT